jgi:hypothetical protein
MDWRNFDESYIRLKDVLRDLMGNGKDKHELDIYGNYLTYGREVKIIVERIEEEVQGYIKLVREISEMAQRGEEPNEKSLDVFVDYHSLIRLDIKSFFIFTRIFIDTLAKIVRLRFDEKRKQQLPPTMTELLKNDKFLTLDPDFAEGFKSKMSWMTAFVETRVEIEHNLGNISRYTTTREGKFGFAIQGSRSCKNTFLGTDKVESITEYMEEILSKLSEAIQYVCSKFPS